MPGEDTPAQHKSSETITDADIQRLVNQLLRFPLTSEHDDAQDVLDYLFAIGVHSDFK